MNSIMWFRRDLRLADNHALTAAVADARAGGGGVIPLFVIDDRLWKPAGTNRRWFLAGCLAALDADLGGRLVVRHGDPAEVVPRVARQHDVARVHRAQDVGIHGRARDEAVATALAADGRELVESDSPWAVLAGTLRTPRAVRSRCSAPTSVGGVSTTERRRSGGRRTCRPSTACAPTESRSRQRSR